MFEFAVTVTVRAAGRDGRSARNEALDVIVSADDHHTVSDLSVALGRALGVGGPRRILVGSNDRTPRPDTPIIALDVRDGDVIELTTSDELGGERVDARIDPGAGRPLEGQVMAIEVICGPDAGRRVELVPGTYGVGDAARLLAVRPAGRGPAALDVEVRDDRSVLAMPATGADVSVNGAAITAPVELGPADVVRLDEHRLVVRSASLRPARWGGGPGQIYLDRTPSRPAAVVHQFAAFGPIPDMPSPRRFGVVTMIAPIILGVGMYLVTGQLMFLMMVALSPIMAVGSIIEDRRSGRREARRRLDDYDARVERRRDEYERARAAERLAATLAAPDLVEIERRAVHTTTGLWCRQRSSDEGVRVRVGIGRTATSYAVELDSGGGDVPRQQAAAAFDELDVLDDAPICVDLDADPIVGLVGDGADVDGFVASIVVQLGVLFSPEDVHIAAALGPARSADWLKWLPHMRPAAPLIGSGYLARDVECGRRLLAAVGELVERRIDGADPHGEPQRWPKLIVFVDAALRLDRADVDRLLERGPVVGVVIVWLGSTATDVVRQATRIVELGWRDHRPTGRLWSATEPSDDLAFTPETLSDERAARIARALAPVRDAGSPTAGGDIPTSVALWDVLGTSRPTPEWIERCWNRAGRFDLLGRFGMGVGGPVALDLVADGPHALIGGTSGSGKSELLQAIVAGLAIAHPPDHLNFLFVDYKGGSSTAVFDRIPHTVGTVSNLNPALAARALRSLRAELNHRMQLLDGRAKDLDDLARIDPGAPPRLVIVVDEFATLVKEIPEFVAGIVDIAQRGRSLGIHLVLATQRPAGSVNDNILANTNLRIALRCIDRADSTAIIDAPDAANIEIERRGRLMMRRGPHELVEVQTGYGGAPADSVVDEPIRVGVFDGPDRRADYAPVPPRRARNPGGESEGGGRTQLDATIDAIAAAAADVQPPRRPWCEPLPEAICLLDLQRKFPECPTTEGRHVIGLADLPDEQAQAPCRIDFDADGGLLVFGSAASGKTQLLRSLAATAPPSTTVVVFDGGSKGMAMVEPLPWVAGVAAADDVEAVTRWIVGLRREIDRRRERGVDDGDACVLVLVDDWSSVLSALDESSTTGPIWSDRLQQLIVDGRSVRVYAVVTADRRAAVSSRLQAALGGRLVLRHADRSAYLDYGIGTENAKTLDLPNGRGLYDDTIVQVGILGDDPSPDGQRRAIEAIAVAAAPVRRCVSADPLPDLARPARTEDAFAIGVADVSAAPVSIELGRAPFAVVGPPGSGRSTALGTVASGADADGWVVALVGPVDCGLAELGPAGAARGFGPGEVARVCSEIDRRSGGRTLLVVDDVDRLDDESTKALDSLVGKVSFAASADTRALTGFSLCTVLDELRRSRRLLVLQPGDSAELMQLTGMRVDIRPGVAMVPGRGVLVTGRTTTLIHVATPAPTGSAASLARVHAPSTD